MNTERIPGKAGVLPFLTSPKVLNVIFILLCLLVICMNLAVIYVDITTPKFGWDFKTYMNASATLTEGKDPYANSSYLNIYYVYPPWTFAIFQPMYLLYRLEGSEMFYHAFQVLMILAAAVILIKSCEKTRYLVLATLLISGFSAVHWNFITGNIAIVYLVLTALLFYFLGKGRFRFAAVVMGMLAAIPLFPVVFNSLFVALKTSWRERGTVILISLGVFAATLFLSYCLAPDLFLSYVRIMSSPASPVKETGSSSTPTSWYLVKSLAECAGVRAPLFTGLALVCFAGAILSALAVFIRKNRGDMVAVYAYVFLVIFLLMPRAKPYYFAMLIVPVYILIRDADIRTKILSVIIVCLLPVSTIGIWWLWPHLPYLLFEYYQPISLILFMAFLLLNPWKQAADTIPDPVKAPPCI